MKIYTFFCGIISIYSWASQVIWQSQQLELQRTVEALWEILASCSKTEGDCQGGTHSLRCLRAAPESARCMAVGAWGSHTCPQARAPGQAKKPPSQRLRVGVGQRQSVVRTFPGLAAFQGLASLICHNSVGSMNASTPPPVHQNQAIKGHPLGSNCKPGALDAKAKAGAKWKAPSGDTGSLEHSNRKA